MPTRKEKANNHSNKYSCNSAQIIPYHLTNGSSCFSRFQMCVSREQNSVISTNSVGTRFCVKLGESVKQQFDKLLNILEHYGVRVNVLNTFENDPSNVIQTGVPKGQYQAQFRLLFIKIHCDTWSLGLKLFHMLMTQS